MARTVRGPSMSCGPGKVHVLGRSTVAGERVFVLKFLQARDPAWQDEVFFARYDEDAVWFDDLQPAFGDEKWFFQDAWDSLQRGEGGGKGSSGQHYLDSVLTSQNLVHATAEC